MKKLLLVLLTVAMLLTLPLGAFSLAAADVEEMTEALKAENGNLALGKDVYVNFSQHTGSGFGRQLITDGDLNGNYTGGSGLSWHSGDSTGSNRATWFAIDFGEKTKLDTVVLYPRTNGNTYDCMANAVRIVAVDDPTITDENLVSPDKREEWLVGDTWIGEGCKNPDWIPYSPAGTIVYEQYDMDLRTADAEPITFQFEAVETQYLVVYGLSLFGPWRSWTIAECAVYNKGYEAPANPYVNLAEGKEVIASSSHEGSPWSSVKLTDGDRYNFNHDRTYERDYGQYVGYHSGLDIPHDGTANVSIDINLGAATAFDTVTVWPSTAKYATTEEADLFVPANYDIQISSDGETWETVKSVSGDEPTEYAAIELTLDAPVTANYLRFLAKGVTEHIKLSEIEVFNKSGSAPDTPEDPEDKGKLSAGNNLFAAHYQTRANGEDSHDVRIVLVANESRFDEINIVKVRVSFVLDSGAEVYFVNTLGGADNDYDLYRTVIAGGDTYEAAEGYALFGNIVTGIPNDVNYTEITVTITDAASGDVLLSTSSK